MSAATPKPAAHRARPFLWHRTLGRVLVCGAALLGGAAQAQTGPAPGAAPELPGQNVQNKQDYSAAEKLLFMGTAMTRLKAPTTLSYSFRKSGTLEESFEDKVSIRYFKPDKGKCCSVSGQFLSGPRKVELPEVEGAEANPVLLYFLEHDVREMQRLTKGAQNYYRKRIRLAAYESARVSEVPLSYRGKSVKGQQVELQPYEGDPARSRFEKHARKTYQFLLSDAVPGGVFGIRTVMKAEAADAPPMIVEELFIDGADAPKNSAAS